MISLDNTLLCMNKKFNSNWEDKTYEGDIVPSALLIIDVATQAFETVYKVCHVLNCFQSL